MSATRWIGPLALVIVLGGAGSAFAGITQLSTGSVELASFGIAELTPERLPAMRVLHVRVTLVNESDPARWVFDARRACLDLPGAMARPLFANGATLGLPVVTVGRGDRRMLDLYFALPPDVDDVAQFAVAWQLETSAGTVAARTVIERDAPWDGIATGWGGRWWADPAHPWPQFYGRPGPVVHRPPARVEVTRRTRAERREPGPDPCSQW